MTTSIIQHVLYLQQGLYLEINISDENKRHSCSFSAEQSCISRFFGFIKCESVTSSCKCWLLFEPGANPCYEGSPNARQTDIPLTSDVAKAY